MKYNETPMNGEKLQQEGGGKELTVLQAAGRRLSKGEGVSAVLRKDWHDDSMDVKFGTSPRGACVREETRMGRISR